MSKKRILLLPTGSRTLQVELIYRHTAMENNVFVPRQGTILPNVKKKLDWSGISVWPTLLSSSPETDELNIDGPARDYRVKHGEDSFVSRQRAQFGTHRPEMKVTIVDATEIINMEFDLCHVFRGTGKGTSIDMARRHIFDKGNVRRWITSEMRPYKYADLGSDIHDDCLITQPSPDDIGAKFKRRWNLFPSRAQLVALNLPDDVLRASQRTGLAGFNHNYQRRYPKESKMFHNAASMLKQQKLGKLVNYGANKPGVGSDIRTSRPNEGKPTISCREALDMKRSLRCVVHLKGGDVGGGVVWYTMLVGTPMIVLRHYYKFTGMYRYFEDGKHCIVIDDAAGVVKAARELNNDAVLDTFIGNIIDLRDRLCGAGDLERFVDGCV